jgi:glycosyltransferase involved in cell wall biosynthesis
MPTVSVVIRAFNEGHHLGRLLAGLKQQAVQPDEIIVVDSGSTDSTVEIATAAGCRVVNIPKEEFSFGRSLNYGCEAATGELLLIVSAHVYPIHDSYLEHMIRPFSDAKTDIVYGRQVGDHRTKFSESRIMLKWFPEESIWDQGHPFSNNANACVRKSTWAKHGYDEELTGLEDLDFANRVISQGGRVAYMAEAPVVHVHEETWATIQNRYRREAIAYKKIMDNETMSSVKALRLAAVNIVSDYWHAAKDGCLRQNLTSIPRFRAAQFYGAWEGFKTSGQVTDELLKRFYYPAEAIKAGGTESLGAVIDYSSSQAPTVQK